MEVYQKYASHLKKCYGDKVYKIPIHIPVTCPNRDGTCGQGGCTFCSEVGAGYEMQDAKMPIAEQLEKNISYISQKYKASYFIGYLQNYSNTYMPLEKFMDIIKQIKHPKLVGISISTRPDCIHEDYLSALKAWKEESGYDICIELGLQTANYHTLKKVNRGHGLAEYLDAVLRIRRYGFSICTHLILNLPWDNEEDVIETAKLMTVLKMDYVKLHALYILKNTQMGKDYVAQRFEMISLEDYMERVILFLRYLSKETIVQRIIGRVPERYTVFANWNTSWWKIHDDIVKKMVSNEYSQGDLCNYTNGKALRRMHQPTKEEAQ